MFLLLKELLQPDGLPAPTHPLGRGVFNETPSHKLQYFISNKYTDISNVARYKVRMRGSGSLTPPQVNEVICLSRLRTQHNHLSPKKFLHCYNWFPSNKNMYISHFYGYLSEGVPQMGVKGC